MTQTGFEAPAESTRLPLLHYRTDGLPAAEALAQWRELMAPLFNIDKARYTSVPPRGNLSVFVLGEIMASRCTFNAQHIWRDAALIAATPDHLVLQYYRSGGFRGVIAGEPVWIVRGQVAVADLSQEMDTHTAASDTIGLSVPRALLRGIAPHALRTQLDAPRNRLLGGYMATLPKRLGEMSVDDIPQITCEIVGVLTRVFAPGPLDDETGLDAELGDDTGDDKLLERALAAIDADLATTGLSPKLLAERIGTSRASLYRIFAPIGGIMRYVQERRLLAAYDSLSDSLDRRPLADVATIHGFTSQATFSRAFRARFGVTPTDLRLQQKTQDVTKRESSPDTAHGLWRDLGRGKRAGGRRS